MGDFFSGVWGWVTGSSISSSLAKTALIGYASKLLSGSTSPTSTGSNEIVDKGVRLQLDPNTDNKIPVLYGEAYFGGYITDAQLSSDYKKMTYCLTLAELTSSKLSDGQPSTYTFEGAYINNNKIVFKADGVTVDYTLDSSGNQDISMRDLVKVYFYCNQTGVQPQGSSGTTPSPWTVMPGWTQTTHPMQYLMYAIVEITYNRDAGVSGLPTFTFHAKNNMTLVGDVLFDYMSDPDFGAQLPTSEIDTDSLVALNAYCTTGFSYTNTSNQTVSSQITINGLVDTKTDVLTNMQALAEAGGSWMTYDIYTGQWKVVINKAGPSIATFTDSNIVGEISISGTSLTQLNNIADVKYQNTDILDQTDFVKISIPAEDLLTNEPENSIQINLPFTNKQVVAAKIGLQQLKQSRVDKIISFSSDYSYIMLRAGDLIAVSNTTYGFDNKMFRIVTVTQGEGDNGSILLNFTALEYDSTVYDYDITEYDVVTDGGILGIGSIGKANTPTVTKTEQANVPKIVINAVVPSGIVDSMEFWITFDTSVVSDSNRNYIKIGTYSNTDGSLLNEDDAVSYTYSGLSQSDFYIKVRGTNNVTNGPFSDPSGLIAYVPVVVADTISNNPVSIGGQIMSLGLLTLLNNVDKLFKGDSSTWSLFGQASQGTGSNITVPAAVGIKDEGTVLSSSAGSINFTGSGVTATASGSDITVNIAGAAAKMDDLTDADTTTNAPSVGDYLYWNGTNWVPDLTKSGPGGANAATSPPASDICDVGGFIAAGSIKIPPKPAPSALSSCSSQIPWSVQPGPGSSYTTTVVAPTKTGPTGGFYYVTYTIPSTTAPDINYYYKVTGISPSGFNGTFLCTASTATSITLKYPSNPGTYSSGAGTATIVKQTGSVSEIALKPLLVKTDTASSYTLSIQPSVGYVSASVYATLTANDLYTYMPTSISGATIAGASGKVGTSSTPLVIVGSYNVINQCLQSFLAWQYIDSVSGNSYDVPIPPTATSATITYSLTVNGVTKTHTETVAYTAYATLHPMA